MHQPRESVKEVRTDHGTFQIKDTITNIIKTQTLRQVSRNRVYE
jgi:hypothetical protein